MMLDEGSVSGAIDALRRQSLVRAVQGIGSRVPKYQHLLAEAGELSRAELAVLCVLALRGPQTRGEVRSRAARLMPGDDPEGIEAALEGLVAREPTPAVSRLARRPGQKEVRYAHLLAGEVVDDLGDAPLPTPTASADRMEALEERVRDLRGDIADLRAQFAEFRKQFE
jgi:hypothetical protein